MAAGETGAGGDAADAGCGGCIPDRRKRANSVAACTRLGRELWAELFGCSPARAAAEFGSPRHTAGQQIGHEAQRPTPSSTHDLHIHIHTYMYMHTYTYAYHVHALASPSIAPHRERTARASGWRARGQRRAAGLCPGGWQGRSGAGGRWPSPGRRSRPRRSLRHTAGQDHVMGKGLGARVLMRRGTEAGGPSSLVALRCTQPLCVPRGVRAG
jgi:hypothetical protein